MDQLTSITDKYRNYFQQQTQQETFLVNIQYSIHSLFNGDTPTNFFFKFPERLNIYSNTDGVILTIQLIGYSLVPEEPNGFIFPGAVTVNSDVLSTTDNPVLGILTGISADVYSAGGVINLGSGLMPTTLIQIGLFQSDVVNHKLIPYRNDVANMKLKDVLYRFQVTRTLTKPVK